MGSLETTEMCITCNGTGLAESRPRVILSEPCLRCKGEGKLDWVEAVMKKNYTYADTDFHHIQDCFIRNIQALQMRMYEEASKIGVRIEVSIEMKPDLHSQLYPTIGGNFNVPY